MTHPSPHDPAPPETLPYPIALARATTCLAEAGVEAPRREARLLLAHVLGRSPRAVPDTSAPVPAAAYAAVLARRAAREPLAYITGRAGFWTFEVAVSPATLIPRADTETVVEAVLAARPPSRPATRILDLGTGTGCLLLALLAEYEGALGVGVDRNPEAARLAAANAAELGLAARALFLAADWTSALGRGGFDVIVSNPPYIPTADIPGLMPEVAGHEPTLALVGGDDGLAAYRILLPAIRPLLAPGGIASFELGVGQAEAVSMLARQAGFSEQHLRADLAGIPRALVLHAPD